MKPFLTLALSIFCIYSAVESQPLITDISKISGGNSLINANKNDLKNALGQYVLYHEVLLEIHSERILYLAIKKSAYQEIFTEPIGQIFLKKHLIKILVFDPQMEVISQWIS